MPHGIEKKDCLVTLAVGKHLFPFRTEKLSPLAPMVLPRHRGGRVGRHQDKNYHSLLEDRNKRLLFWEKIKIILI
jgi:hypothetical protein